MSNDERIGPGRKLVPAPLPLEAGKPRVQRLVDELAVVHLEADVPVSEDWSLTVDGLVDKTVTFDLATLRDQFGVVERVDDFHCVWGWSRPQTRWRGVPVEPVLAAAGVKDSARFVSFQALDSPYDSCVPIGEAIDGLLALELEGEPISSDHGGPLRWMQPNYLWGYKGVKWLTKITLRDELVPGFWESKVGDVEGRVPEGILDLFEEQLGSAAESSETAS